ncbi:MAG: HEAT repeat domain-containing protein [Acidobacteriaceae bacterium]|nr:HEAT repeat domain-containing protein [Acidobacteriaceae bacterium]MBV9502452.1 HEAT repeat domain-containing protein [Acidobacteriaceae bacterium]
MTCREARLNLSLYLYGELDFAREEAFEQHLSSCALCQRAFAREKAWHTSLNSERRDVDVDLLMECRQDLRVALAQRKKERSLSWLMRWMEPSRWPAGRWSVRLALASFLVFLGFSASRWMERAGLAESGFGGGSLMSVLNPATARVRDIQPDGQNGVRIIVDQVKEREITGSPEDDSIRRLLVAAMNESLDPGIRVDSAEMLRNQAGERDVRDALLNSVRKDPNAAVRLKALEALRRFSSDPATRDTLAFVLQHDDNPGVRSEAIDILAPAGQKIDITPDLALTLQSILRSEPEDDYVRNRCLQVLQRMNASGDVY